jgi:hypothetical protein
MPNTSLRVLYEIGGDSGDGGDSFEISGLFPSPLNVQVVTVVTAQHGVRGQAGARIGPTIWPIRQSQDRRAAGTGELGRQRQVGRADNTSQ